MPVSLGDHCDFLGGFAFKSQDLKKTDGIPVIKIKNVNDKVVKMDDVQFFPVEKMSSKLNKFLLADGDVLIAMTGQGSVGRVGRFRNGKNQKVLLNQRVGKFLPKESLDLGYLYYILSSEKFEKILFNAASGSGQPNLSPDIIKSIEIPFLPKNEQVKVAEALEKLDEKIALNQQTNQTLEQMAQALFKSWFVDFDPVIDNALAAGSEIPDALQHRVEIRKKAHALQKQNANIQPLPAATQRLFPSEFEHCGDDSLGILGWIPKGWISDVLASIAELSTSRMDGAQLTLENYISTENMLPYKQGVTKASSIPQLKTTPSFKAGQVLISNIRPYFKKIWLANRDGGRSNDVLGFDAIEPRTESYIMNLLSQDKFFDFMMTTAKGSKMPRGDKKAIMDWGVVVPPVQIRELYSKLVGDFNSANSNRTKENDSLVQLRDTLLPKLISGEVILETQIHHAEGV